MTKILIKRGQAEANLPTLDPGEPAITFESGGKFWVGTPSGNLEITGGGGGSPGGSDTQIQFNDGGSFGGASSLIYDSLLGDFRIYGDSNNSLFHSDFSANTIGFGTNGATGTIASFSPSLIVYNDDGGDIDFRVESDTYGNMFKIDAGLNTVEIGTAAQGTIAQFGVSGIIFNEEGADRDFRLEGGTATNLIFVDAGLDAVQIGTTVAGQIADFRGSSIVFNENGADIDFRIEGDTATNLFIADAGLDAIQIGTTTSGDIADFRSSAIVFNESGDDRDFRVEGDTDQNLFFVDASTDRVGIGTDAPVAYLNVSKTTTGASASPVTGTFINNVYSPTSNPGSVFPISLQLTADYSSSITPSGGFQLAQLLDVRNTGNGSLSARCLDILYRNTGTGTVGFVVGTNIRTPINSGGGAITTAYGLKIENQTTASTNYAIYTDSGTVRFGGGVILGSPTGGDKGAGTLNASGDIYKNNSAFTNPDYVFEKYFTGKIEKYIKNQGAKDYSMTPLVDLKDYVKSNLHLPTRPSGALGIFERSDWVQEKLEELAIYIIELHERIDKLEKGMV